MLLAFAVLMLIRTRALFHIIIDELHDNACIGVHTATRTGDIDILRPLIMLHLDSMDRLVGQARNIDRLDLQLPTHDDTVGDNIDTTDLDILDEHINDLLDGRLMMRYTNMKIENLLLLALPDNLTHDHRLRARLHRQTRIVIILRTLRHISHERPLLIHYSVHIYACVKSYVPKENSRAP